MARFVGIVAVTSATSAFAINGSQDTQVKGLGGYEVSEIMTIGETFNGYTPVGILDGMGAYDLGNNTVRVLANHELTSFAGYSYQVNGGVDVTGARVSYFDIDKTSRQLIGTGMAYDTIIGAAGTPITNANQLGDGDGVNPGGGISRLCSANFVAGGTFGFVDNVFLTGEEDSNANGGRGGYEYALDTANNTLYSAPALGFAAWESVTPLDTGRDDKVALLVGDDRQGAPAYLYVGNKDMSNGAGFLERNGLADGQVYAWKADGAVPYDVDINGDPTNTGTNVNPIDFRGTGTSMNGSWVQITDLSSIAAQDTEARLGGAFEFSRPEDVHTSPTDPTVAVFTSTGRTSWLADVNGGESADYWGTTYTFDVDFAFDANGELDLANAGAVVDIIYDGNDSGNGDFGIRSPDNLVWAEDGSVYLQEDRAVSPTNTQPGFGGASGEETSIWKLDPTTSVAERVAQVDRLAVLPDMQTDNDPTDLGDWETSGIIDVSTLFGEEAGTLFMANVQAHSIRDGSIADFDLVQGGQLVFMQVPEPSSIAICVFGLVGLLRMSRKRG